MATMLGVRDDRRAGRAGAAAARAGGGDRRRSTRSPWTASARPTIACSRWPTARAAWRSTRPTTRAGRGAARRSCEPLAHRHRPRRRGRDQAGHRSTSPARASDAEAQRAARAIANSPLVKTAIHGGDPNWGRLVAVAGRAGVGRSTSIARACASATWSCSRTAGRSTSARRRRPSISKGTKSSLRVDLGTGGSGTARMWTCDLSAEYVKINAEYRT